MSENLEIVIITGMSGAGKTVAVQSFEDAGYYCIDNMPPDLIGPFIDLAIANDSLEKAALVVDLRSREFFSELNHALALASSKPGISLRILFLDSDNNTLVSRYKETRRAHPMEPEGRILDGIKRERQLLANIRDRANLVIDTSNLSPKELRQKIISEFMQDDYVNFRVELISFGFKHGLPIDADVVMDVRFLPNPHYIDELRPMTGVDQPVYDYVMEHEATETFFEKFTDLLDFILPGYQEEGKATVTIAIGCTGGNHRSVALIERLNKKLQADGYETSLNHRDILKRKEPHNS